MDVKIWTPAIALLSCSVIATFAFAARPMAGAPLALVFPPWWNSAQVSEAAAAVGPVIGSGAGGFIVIVSPSRTRQQWRAPGALLTLDAQAIAFCIAQESA